VFWPRQDCCHASDPASAHRQAPHLQSLSTVTNFLRLLQGERALDFVLRNQGLIDKTLLIDVELIKIS